MARKHKPEEIIGKLREAEIVLAQGGTVADACRRIGVTEQGYYRWRKEYGGLKMDQARRMKELEQAIAPLFRPHCEPCHLSCDSCGHGWVNFSLAADDHAGLRLAGRGIDVIARAQTGR